MGYCTGVRTQGLEGSRRVSLAQEGEQEGPGRADGKSAEPLEVRCQVCGSVCVCVSVSVFLCMCKCVSVCEGVCT